jgi:DNA-binding MurR/RpiR family transcriptional regulator
VLNFISANREEALVASAQRLADHARTSDATVVRAARSLDYAGLNDLRRALANELRRGDTPANRLARTLKSMGDEHPNALHETIATTLTSLSQLERDVDSKRFEAASRLINDTGRVFVFGIGPSGAIASYFALQLERIGVEASALTHAGISLADELLHLRSGGVVVALAYGNVYAEVDCVLRRAAELGLASLLVTDSLDNDLKSRVGLVLHAARGNNEMFAMHTATLCLVEALLVGVASRRQNAALASLEELARLRAPLRPRSDPAQSAIGRARAQTRR